MSERVEDRQLHRRKAQLCQYAPIEEFDKRMHNALRVDYHLQSIVRQAEQMVRLDQLQSLVGQGSAVYRNLASHLPRWVLQRFLDGSRVHPVGRPLPEWSTRRRQDQSRQTIVPA